MAKGDVKVRGFRVIVKEVLYLEDDNGKLSTNYPSEMTIYEQHMPEINVNELAVFLNE